MKNNHVKEGYKFWEIRCAETVFYTNYFWMQELEIQMKIVIRTLILQSFSFNHSPIEIQRSMWWVWINFNFPRVLIGLRGLSNTVVVTAREIIGWSPKQINNMYGILFNTIQWINDEIKFHIQKWIDNNVVTIITTLHTSEYTIRKIRKKHGLTRLPMTIWVQFGAQNIKNQSQFPESQMITTVGYLELIGQTSWLIIIVIIFGSGKFVRQ